MTDFMKPFGNQSFLVGLGVAAVGYFLGPQIKEMVRPAAVRGAQGLMMMTDKTKHMMGEGKHMMGSMMSMERGDHRGNEQMGMMEMVMRELREERERSNRLMEQLNGTISNLRDEISHMKENGGQVTQ